MKILITLPVTKTIDDKTRWVAQDSDGQWYSYETKPRAYEVYGQWYKRNGLSYLIIKGEPNPDWKDTLIRIKKAKVVI